MAIRIEDAMQQAEQRGREAAVEVIDSCVRGLSDLIDREALSLTDGISMLVSQYHFTEDEARESITKYMTQ